MSDACKIRKQTKHTLPCPGSCAIGQLCLCVQLKHSSMALFPDCECQVHAVLHWQASVGVMPVLLDPYMFKSAVVVVLTWPPSCLTWSQTAYFRKGVQFWNIKLETQECSNRNTVNPWCIFSHCASRVN